MGSSANVWLVTNPASGSNRDALLAELNETCERCDLCVENTVRFPDDDLPTREALTANGVDTVIVFAGDGTINAAITQLSGWSGAVLPLPGGTMNLLPKRLHADVPAAEIVAQVAAGRGRRTRPTIVRCELGFALAGLLIGPGTRWNLVREAMRDFDIGAMFAGAGEAMEETTGDALVTVTEPELGAREGYPLIELTPVPGGIELAGYHADDAGEFLEQGWALLRRSFREGPHDELGMLGAFDVVNVAGRPLEMLFDGEPASGPASLRFETAECPVDLVATLPE